MSGENNALWLGGHTQYRGKNWNIQKAQALERDNYLCQKCQEPSVVVHHIKPYHLFTNYKEANQLDNLISLCKRCHGIEEIEFYKNNKCLDNGRHIPHLKPELKICGKCNNPFIPSTSKVRWCDKCRTYTCANCGTSFFSRRYRTVKFCSKKCRNEFISNPPLADDQ